MSYIGTAMDRLPCVMLATLSSVAMLGGQDDLLRLELVKDFFLTSMMLHCEEVLLLVFRCLDVSLFSKVSCCLYCRGCRSSCRRSADLG